MEQRQAEFGGQTLENFSFETGNGNQRNDHVPDRPPLIIQTRNILTALSELGTNTTLTTSCFCVGHHSPHYPKLGTPTVNIRCRLSFALNEVTEALEEGTHTLMMVLVP